MYASIIEGEGPFVNFDTLSKNHAHDACKMKKRTEATSHQESKEDIFQIVHCIDR